MFFRQNRLARKPAVRDTAPLFRSEGAAMKHKRETFSRSASGGAMQSPILTHRSIAVRRSHARLMA
jgi:hypothetical protein